MAGHAGNVKIGGSVVLGDEVTLISGVVEVKQFLIRQQDEALAYIGGSYDAVVTLEESGVDSSPVDTNDGVHNRSAEVS